jgi:ABC-type uncharacterized transport system ATPase subunit
LTGLDRDGVELLENLVAEQRAAGTSILMVTHDLARVSLLADQAVLLGRGRVAWQGQGNDLAPERLEQAWRDMASGQGGSIATNGGTQTC